MKTREQIYGQEAAGLLRDVSMYRALTEMQLLKLYPHKESKIRNLLSYLQSRAALCSAASITAFPLMRRRASITGFQRPFGFLPTLWSR